MIPTLGHIIPTLGRPLASESIKLRRGSLPRLPLFGLLAALLEGILFLTSPHAVHTWKMLGAWHIVWVTFLSPLALALLAGLAAQREAQARWGGTRWRPVTPQALVGAQFAALAVLALAMDLFVILGSLPFGLAVSLPGSAPVGHELALVAVLWAASLPMLALYQSIAAWWGLVPAILAGLVGAVLGVLYAEEASWAFVPWAWPVHATLTLLGTHANGLALEPNSPLWHVSPWPPMLLALAATPPLVWLAASLTVAEHGSRLRHRRSPSTVDVRVGAPRAPTASPPAQRVSALAVATGRYRASALAAEMVKHRRSALPWLAILAPTLAVAAVALLRHPGTSALQGWALLVVPFVAALLPARAWLWEHDAWRALCARPISPGRLYVAKLAILWLWVAAGTTLLCAGLNVLGMPIGTLLVFWLLDLSVALLLLALHLLLAMRAGVSVTLATGAFGTLLALLLGGTELGTALWPIVPWTWGWVPYTSGQALFYALAALLLGGIVALVGARLAEHLP